MSRSAVRRICVPILLAFLLVTAGCSDLADDGSESLDEPDRSAAANDTDAGDESDGVTDDDPERNATDYEFTLESYTYRITASTIRQDEPPTTTEITWEVVGVNDGEVTVDYTTRAGTNDPTTYRFSDTQDEIIETVTSDPRTRHLLALRDANVVAAGHDLSPGNNFTVRAEEFESGVTWDRATVTVVGTDSYGGVDCTMVQFHPYEAGADRQPDRFNACVNTEYPFAPSVSSTRGELRTVELIEKER